MRTDLRFWPKCPKNIAVGSSFVVSIDARAERVWGSARVPHVEGKRVEVQVGRVPILEVKGNDDFK